MFDCDWITAVCSPALLAAWVPGEVSRQPPPIQIEAAQALGATKWEVIRMAVLPFGRSGVIAASMLGLGRAMGETIAVALVLSAVPGVNWHILQNGGGTLAPHNPPTFPEARPNSRERPHPLAPAPFVSS